MENNKIEDFLKQWRLPVEIYDVKTAKTLNLVELLTLFQRGQTLESSQPIQGAVTSPEGETAEEILNEYPQYTRDYLGLNHLHPPMYISVKCAAEAAREYASQFIQPSLPVLQLKEKIEEEINLCRRIIDDKTTNGHSRTWFIDRKNAYKQVLSWLSESLSSSLPASSPEEKEK